MSDVLTLTGSHLLITLHLSSMAIPCTVGMYVHTGQQGRESQQLCFLSPYMIQCKQMFPVLTTHFQITDSEAE